MSDDQPNLDLINMVQNARMMHDATAKPSELAAVYWIEAKRQQGDYPDPTPRSGEWRISLTADEADTLWEIVKQATIDGKLGYKSKISTKPGPGQGNLDDRMICVRTYDADDADDVNRIKAELETLNLAPSLVYVRDTDR